MSGLIVSSAISSKQARPDGALHVKSRLQIKSGACKERRNAVTHIDLVHGYNWRVIYLYAPHDLLSFANASVHPFQDVVKALLQSHISNVLAALMVIIELGIKRLLVGWQTICDHQPRLHGATYSKLKARNP